jgi:hypothetical protein
MAMRFDGEIQTLQLWLMTKISLLVSSIRLIPELSDTMPIVIVHFILT